MHRHDVPIPNTAAAAYGISVGQECSWRNLDPSVKGVRDVASGLMTFVLIAAREPTCWLASCWLPR